MAIDVFNRMQIPAEAEPALDGGAGEDMAAPYVMAAGGGGNGSFGARRSDHQKLIAWIDHPNIAEELDEEDLNKIAQRVKREYDIDYGTLDECRERWDKALDLAMQVAQEKTHPWPKASNVVYPALTVAAIQFGARSYPAIVSGRSIVKGIVSGPDNGIPQLSPQDGTPLMQMTPQGPQPLWAVPPGAKRERAKRIGEHMSWQLLEEMTEWARETDRLLHLLPIIGTVFRKTYFDPGLHHHRSVMVMAQNLIINYWAKSVETASRLSEELKFYPREIEEQVRAGQFLDQDYGMADNANGDDDAPHEFIEQHRWLDLDDDGYPEPYIVTMHKSRSKIARISARYDADGVQVSRKTGEVARIEPVHYYTQYDFWPSLDGGIYGTGLGQLLGPINSAVNTTLNMMFDAEHLKIAGGGFIGRGMSMHSGAIKFKPGEWKIVNVPGQAVRDSFVPLPAEGASSVLFTLLGFLTEAGREIANTKDILSGDVKAQTMQPTTLIALIDQGLKVFTAIYKRVHDSAKSEFTKLYRLNRIYGETMARYQVGDEWKTVSREDYAKGAGVKPVSDPAMVSDMQKMAKTQFLLGFVNDPRIKGLEILKEAFDNAQVETERFIETKPQPNPAIIAKTAEMELEGNKAEAAVATERARQANLWADTLKKLAEADKTNGELPLEWTAQYIDLLTQHMNSLMEPAEGQPAQPPAPHPDEVMPPPPGTGQQLMPPDMGPDMGMAMGQPGGEQRMSGQIMPSDYGLAQQPA